jgi:hypothetical protein
MVGLVAILRHGLLIMASFAQGLPVALVPEELFVTTVWNNVINNRSFS